MADALAPAASSCAHTTLPVGGARGRDPRLPARVGWTSAACGTGQQAPRRRSAQGLHPAHHAGQGAAAPWGAVPGQRKGPGAAHTGRAGQGRAGQGRAPAARAGCRSAAAAWPGRLCASNAPDSSSGAARGHAREGRRGTSSQRRWQRRSLLPPFPGPPLQWNHEHGIRLFRRAGRLGLGTGDRGLLGLAHCCALYTGQAPRRGVQVRASTRGLQHSCDAPLCLLCC